MITLMPQHLRVWAIFGLSFSLVCFALPNSQSIVIAQNHEHPVPERLGTVHFRTSCSADVQPQFERAVALLHSFAYSAVEKAFRAVLAKDTNCAMAHWGVAMTYFHQLWDRYLTPQDTARSALELDQAARLPSTDR